MRMMCVLATCCGAQEARNQRAQRPSCSACAAPEGTCASDHCRISLSCLPAVGHCHVCHGLVYGFKLMLGRSSRPRRVVDGTSSLSPPPPPHPIPDPDGIHNKTAPHGCARPHPLPVYYATRSSPVRRGKGVVSLSRWASISTALCRKHQPE